MALSRHCHALFSCARHCYRVIIPIMKTSTRAFLAPRLGTMEQLASIRRLTSDDGRARGMRLIEVDNGSGLSFTVLPDRGMDIGAAAFKGQPLAWLGANGMVAPHFYHHEGFEWLRTWPGGLLTGCGLVNVGGPSTVNGDNHGLHGRLSHLPAEEVNTTAAWRDDQSYVLSVTGRVRHTKVFGEKLHLTRHITTALNDNSITVRDTIENCGFDETPMLLLYHINLGWPLVDEGAYLESNAHEVKAFTPVSEVGIARWNQIEAPTPGFQEQLFIHTATAAPEASIRLVNPKLGLALRVAHDTSELPYLAQWKMMGQGEYVLGLEPANCMPDGYSANAERGTLRLIAPGAKVETYVKLTIEEV